MRRLARAGSTRLVISRIAGWDASFSSICLATPSVPEKLVPEGIEGRVPYKGSLAEVVIQYLGGLRAGMGYCGAPDLETLRSSKFVKITSAAVTESHPHNITITKEAPNYSQRR